MKQNKSDNQTESVEEIAFLNCKVLRRPPSLAGYHYTLEPGRKVYVLFRNGEHATVSTIPHKDTVSEDYFRVRISSLDSSRPLPLEHAREYDAAAEHFARKGELPANMGSPGAIDDIQSDSEAFESRVRDFDRAKYPLDSH